MSKVVLTIIFTVFTLAIYAQDHTINAKAVGIGSVHSLDFDFDALQEIPANGSLAGHTYIFKKDGKNYYYTGEEVKVQNLFINSIEVHGEGGTVGCPQPLPANCVCSNGYMIQKM